MIHLLLGGPSPLHLKFSSKKVSMFKRRMSYTNKHFLHDHVQDWKAILGGQRGPSYDVLGPH